MSSTAKNVSKYYHMISAIQHGHLEFHISRPITLSSGLGIDVDMYGEAMIEQQSNGGAETV